MVNDLDHKDIEFRVSKTYYKTIEQKNNMCINVFCYENGLTYPINISKQNFKDYMDLLLINDENLCLYQRF